MTDTHQSEKTHGEQMADLLRRKPKNFDVTFSVGPEKIKVEAVKFILKAASSVFEREFDDNWENAVVREGEGIPLPDLDPTTFQLFVNLIILDAWSVDSVKAIELSPNNFLNLLGLCRRYKITKAIRNLEDAATDVLQYFAEYTETKEFLKISRENLETIFSLEKILLDEMEIFDCACRWAANQCTIKGLEPTGENYREVLGGCLFEIRFPTMSFQELTKACLVKKKVLKDDEKLAIFLFMGLSIDERTNYGKTQLPFKTNPRVAIKSNSSNSDKAKPQIIKISREVNTSSFDGCSVLSLPPQYKLTTSPPFKCNGSKLPLCFQVSQEKISLCGFGFLGPIHGDTNFEVTVQIRREVRNSWTFDSGTFKQNISARKGEIFYFLLDKPIAIKSSTTYDSSWCNCYYIIFSVEERYNISQYLVDNPRVESFQASGVEFHLYNSWNNGNPLAEVLFKKI